VSVGSAIGAVLGFVRSKLKLIVIVGVSVVGGLALAGVYGSAIDYTSKLDFCAHTCHEMQDTVYQEYTHSRHFKNEYGVVVPCAKCHVPQDNWPATFGHKVLASFELYNHFILGESDPKKFTPRRLELAKKVWAGFAATNARECKACHKYSNMLLDEQRTSLRAQHTDAMKTDENCLDCHKGITHTKPVDPTAAPAGGAGGGFDVQ
jgi:nitrate/TMAO reductase-like tetraheme cytochrome c subunit